MAARFISLSKVLLDRSQRGELFVLFLVGEDLLFQKEILDSGDSRRILKLKPQ